MRTWMSILALCLVTVSAPLAQAAPGTPAPVSFHGLQFQPVGSCAVSDGGHKDWIEIDNIGSSGQDGVSVSMLHMDGLSLSLDGGSSSASDVGARCAMTYSWSLVGRPPVSASAAFTVTPTGIDCRGNMGSLSSSPMYSLTLSSSGVVVFSASVDPATAVSVANDPTGGCPNPALSCSASEGHLHRPPVCLLTWGFSTIVHVTVAGQQFDCDDIEMTAPVDLQNEGMDGLSGDLRIASPPGSSFSTVGCSSASAAFDHHYVDCDGDALLSVSATPGGQRRPVVSNLGSSGLDGVRVALGKSPVERLDVDGAAVSCVFAPPSLSFDPALDNGASASLTVQGTAFSSVQPAQTTQVSILMQMSMSGGVLYVSCDHSSLGVATESLVVIRHGVEVARAAMYSGAAVQVTAPPGGSPVAPVAYYGKSHELTGNVTLIKGPMLAQQSRAGSTQALGAATKQYVDSETHMQASFRCDRVFVVGGLQITGDEIVFWAGPCSSGTCADGFAASSTQLRVACPNPASSLSSLSLLGFSSSSGDEVFADVPSSTSLSSAHTCVTVPVDFARTDATPVRAFSVTFHLSAELAACGASVVEGDYLSKVASTQMFVQDNGGGSYTVDCGILGPVCGATGNGHLFSVSVGSSAIPPLGDVGAVTVDAVTVRDCSNQPVVAQPGSDGFIPLQFTAPPAVTGLTAVQQKSGNTPAGETAKEVTSVVVTVQGPGLSLSVDLFRKGFGNYPLYDKGATPGAVPSPPASPAAALASGWTPVTCSSGACSSSSCSSGGCTTTVVDLPPSRDFEYYVAFARDLYGNTSPVSNMTPGTLDYFLGDVSDGASTCTGDDHVDIADISALGSHYGASVAAFPSLACLDVGPTTNYSVDARPTVDGKIGFEDFVMFAINFSVVSAPQYAARPMAAATDAVRLTVPATLPEVGSTFDASVLVDGAGDAQALSVRLDYDHAVLEQVGVANGSLLDAQGRAGLVLSSGPGNVDAALLGAGPGIAGGGELARVTFRVLSAGEAKLAIAGVSARDVANHPVPVAGVDAGAVADARTGLGFLFPNPFQQAVEIRLSLRRDGPAKLAVYDVAGRRVRLLLDGVQPAGSRTVSWDGRDDAGLKLAPGAYLVRLEAAGHDETRAVRLVR